MNDFENDVEQCINVLKNGGLILYPTDTIWGIGCDATNETAVAKIYALKKRDDQKSMIILTSSLADLNNYTNNVNDKIFAYLQNNNKPTSVIYPTAKNLATNLINSNGSIAIRIVKDEFCLQLLKAWGKPIVSTSANISGMPSPTFFKNIEAEIKKGVDYIVQNRQNDFEIASPSTIVKLDDNGEIIVIRP
jgi:L-threonylcarbamoyladenylate synthase